MAGSPASGAGGLWWAGYFGVGLFALVPALYPLFHESGIIPLGTRLLAALLWIGGWLPAVHYVATSPERRRPIPFLPLVGVLYVMYYALPVLLDADPLNASVFVDPAHDYAAAVWAALTGWMAVMGGYSLFNRRQGFKAFDRLADQLPDAAFWGGVLLGMGLAVRIASMATPSLAVLAGLTTFLSSMSWFGTALLILTWRRGKLAHGKRPIVVLGIALLCGIELGTGLLSSLGLLVVTIVFAYLAARPAHVGGGAQIVFVLVLGLLLLMKGATSDFRQVAWWSGQQLSLFERAALMSELTLTRVEQQGFKGAIGTGAEATVSRSSNADLLAEIIRRTPRDVPYWNGETYLSLLGAFVPRLLWPNKPVKNLGQQFGHRYGYLDVSDNNTSFNLPWVVESYANFGFNGVLVVGFFVGSIYAILFRLINNFYQSEWIIALGIVVVVPLVNIESDFSIVFGGLPLTMVSWWLLLKIISLKKSYK